MDDIVSVHILEAFEKLSEEAFDCIMSGKLAAFDFENAVVAYLGSW